MHVCEKLSGGNDTSKISTLWNGASQPWMFASVVMHGKSFEENSDDQYDSGAGSVSVPGRSCRPSPVASVGIMSTANQSVHLQRLRWKISIHGQLPRLLRMARNFTVSVATAMIQQSPLVFLPRLCFRTPPMLNKCKRRSVIANLLCLQLVKKMPETVLGPHI